MTRPDQTLEHADDHDHDEAEVGHDPETGRFFIPIDPPAHEVVLQYRTIDDKTLDFRSTLVPPGHRGEGLGERVVRHALDWARANGIEVVPSCSFVKSWIDDHPDYHDLQTGDP